MSSQNKPARDGHLAYHKQATELMDLYFDKIHGGKEPTDVYGYVFSLESLKELMAAIEKQNASGSSKKVYGVRMYESYDPTPRPGAPGGCKSALLVPVDEKMEDLIRINKFARYTSPLEEGVVEPIIDIEPRPCPPLCNIEE